VTDDTAVLDEDYTSIASPVGAYSSRKPTGLEGD
jgi:hypothetical protein